MKNEKVMEMIFDLEDNEMVVTHVVINNIKFSIVEIEEVEKCEEITHIGVVRLEDYKENGFDIEGLETIWIEVK